MLTRETRLDRASPRYRLCIAALGWSGWLFSRVHYRLYAAAAKVVGRICGPGAHCTVRIADDTVFKIDLGDFYYNRLVSRYYEYEPELDRLLSWFRDIDYVFLDCGANYGYWSLKVSGAQLGAKRVIAVEAYGPTVRRLIENRTINHRDFEILHFAVAQSSGSKVKIFSRGSHAGSSLVEHWLGNPHPISGTSEVETICVDDIAERASIGAGTPVVLKLDVEGVEIEALRGAHRLLAGNSVVIYEEYGEDTSCKVSRFVLDELGMAVFYVSDSGEMLRVHDAVEVQSLKKHKTKGYNFVAANPGSVFYARLADPTRRS